MVEIFRELSQSYRFTPLRLLSGLAEGADRLVAHAACKNGIELVACLPMKRTLYEREFETVESRGEFQELLNCAAEIVALPLVDDNTAENIQDQGPQRDKQYQALGEFLVEQSQILIALWNGEATNRVGGTSWIVQLQLGQQPSCDSSRLASPLDYPETGPVYQVVTPRSSNAATVGEPYTRQERYHPGFESDEAARKAYKRIFGRTDLFNRDALEGSSELEGLIQQSKESLIPATSRNKMSHELQGLIDNYALADALAIYFQRLTKRSMQRLIFVYGWVGLFLFALFGHGPSALQAPALFGYLLVIYLAFRHYRFAKSQELKTRHLDYRALAEGLRLQLFWKLGGLNHTVANHYLRKQRSELDWIRHAIRVWGSSLHRTTLAPDLPLVYKHWIQDQLKFFDRATRREAAHHRCELNWTWRPIYALVSIAAVVAGLTAINWFSGSVRFPYLTYRQPGASNHATLELHGAAVIMMTVLAGVTGAVAAYSLKMAFNEQRKQYLRMRNLYQRASGCIAQALADKDDGLVHKIMTDLGKEALEENGDWVLLHRERPFELRIGA